MQPVGQLVQFGEAGRHTRTTVGVYQLPKNAAVELDLVAVKAAEPDRY